MPKSAQKLKSTTQKFTEIFDISENTVFLTNGAACLIIEVTATNFALQSDKEQEAKILAYASLLNSLSFQIQIVINNKKLDISSYLGLLDNQIKESKNNMFSQQMGLYRDFVAELVKVNTVLDKRFYIIIPYSPLERGVSGAKTGAMGASTDPSQTSQAKLALKSKSESLLNQISRLSLKGRVLEKDDLVRVFYEIYNGSISQEVKLSEYEDPIVKGKSK